MENEMELFDCIVGTSGKNNIVIVCFYIEILKLIWLGSFEEIVHSRIFLKILNRRDKERQKNSQNYSGFINREFKTDAIQVNLNKCDSLANSTYRQWKTISKEL